METIAFYVFDRSGFSISMASASIMTELIRRKSPEDIRTLKETVLSVFRVEILSEELDQLGDLTFLKGFPVPGSALNVPTCRDEPWKSVSRDRNESEET